MFLSMDLDDSNCAGDTYRSYTKAGPVSREASSRVTAEQSQLVGRLWNFTPKSCSFRQSAACTVFQSQRGACLALAQRRATHVAAPPRSEEHTSELQSHSDLVCRLL